MILSRQSANLVADLCMFAYDYLTPLMSIEVVTWDSHEQTLQMYRVLYVADCVSLSVAC